MLHMIMGLVRLSHAYIQDMAADVGAKQREGVQKNLRIAQKGVTLTSHRKIDKEGTRGLFVACRVIATILSVEVLVPILLYAGYRTYCSGFTREHKIRVWHIIAVKRLNSSIIFVFRLAVHSVCI